MARAKSKVLAGGIAPSVSAEGKAEAGLKVAGLKDKVRRLDQEIKKERGEYELRINALLSQREELAREIQRLEGKQ